LQVGKSTAWPEGWKADGRARRRGGIQTARRRVASRKSDGRHWNFHSSPGRGNPRGDIRRLRKLYDVAFTFTPGPSATPRWIFSCHFLLQQKGLVAAKRACAPLEHQQTFTLSREWILLSLRHLPTPTLKSTSFIASVTV